MLLTSPLQAQRLGLTKGFKVLGENFDAPHDTQPRYVLEGATAQSRENGDQLLTGVKLQTFNETGGSELLIRAPQCFYDRSARSVRSPGALQMQTTDGKFLIQGEGFLWQQTNSTLFISNQVHTTIAPEMLDKTALSTNQPASQKSGPLEIYADAFDYSRESGFAHYRRNVRVFGTNQLGLLAQFFEIKLPAGSGTTNTSASVPKGLDSLRAEKDVVLDYSGVQATGQTALYTAQTGLLHLTGNPAWRADQRQGKADELTVDPSNRVFRAEGNAWFRSPAQGMNIAGLLSQTNASAPAVKMTNQYVEVQSAFYEFRTNWANFGGDVRLREFLAGQVRGTMNCGLLSAAFQGTNQLETLTARTNVVMEDGTNWLKCGVAVLTGSNGVLEATQSPAWGAGSRSGKGDFVRMDMRAKEMLVRGNASLQVPARELAQTLTPQPGVTNSTGLLLTNGFAQIFSEEYTLTAEGARFKGGVYATHPRMNWTCGLLAVDLAQTGQRRQTLVAETGVKFQLRGERGDQMEGTAEKAVYVYGVEGVVTNDLLTLTGFPATLQTTNGTMRNGTIIYDRVKNILRTPGSYSISGTNKSAGTNLLVLPKSKLTR